MSGFFLLMFNWPYSRKALQAFEEPSMEDIPAYPTQILYSDGRIGKLKKADRRKIFPIPLFFPAIIYHRPKAKAIKDFN